MTEPWKREGANGFAKEPDPATPENVALRQVDAVIQGVLTDGTNVLPGQSSLTPQGQMGVLIMALVLATRRFMRQRGNMARPFRMRIIKECVKQYEGKLRDYVAAGDVTDGG